MGGFGCGGVVGLQLPSRATAVGDLRQHIRQRNAARQREWRARLTPAERQTARQRNTAGRAALRSAQSAAAAAATRKDNARARVEAREKLKWANGQGIGWTRGRVRRKPVVRTGGGRMRRGRPAMTPAEKKRKKHDEAVERAQSKEAARVKRRDCAKAARLQALADETAAAKEAEEFAAQAAQGWPQAISMERQLDCYRHFIKLTSADAVRPQICAVCGEFNTRAEMEPSGIPFRGLPAAADSQARRLWNNVAALLTAVPVRGVVEPGGSQWRGIPPHVTLRYAGAPELDGLNLVLERRGIDTERGALNVCGSCFLLLQPWA